MPPDLVHVGLEASRPWPAGLRQAWLRVPPADVDEIRHDLQRTGEGVRSSPTVDHLRDLVAGALAAGGLAILTGDGFEHFSDDHLARVHLAVGNALGERVGQNGTNDTLIDVRATHLRGTPGVRGYQDSDGMLLHSDAADYSGLMCLSQADAGGSNLFASALDIHDAIANEAAELLPLYYTDWFWDVGALGLPGVDRAIRLPVFSVHAGRLSCRYSPSLLRAGAAATGGHLSAAQDRALNLFEHVARRSDIAGRHRLARGQSVWMNNQTLLHGREAFDDGVGRGRHLLRVWVRSAAIARSQWPRIAEFDDHLFKELGRPGHDNADPS